VADINRKYPCPLALRPLLPPHSSFVCSHTFSHFYDRELLERVGDINRKYPWDRKKRALFGR
jgi:hypothetical protein